jgi:hypothetical protein
LEYVVEALPKKCWTDVGLPPPAGEIDVAERMRLAMARRRQPGPLAPPTKMWLWGGIMLLLQYF